MEKAEEFSLTQNAGLVGIAKFVNILGLLAASMILTRLLSRSEYGNYEQVWLVYNSFVPLIGIGLSSSIYYFAAREDRRAVYSSAIASATVVGVFSGVVLAVFAPAIAHWFGADVLTKYIRIFALYAVLSSPSLMFESIFVTERKVGLLLAGNIMLAVLFALSILSAALFFHSLTVVFVSIAVVGAVKTLYLLFFLIRARKFLFGRLSPVLKAELFFALPILVSGIAGTISKQVDRYLVSFFFTPDKFAIYAIGSKELPMIGVITGAASAVLFPVFSELGSGEGRGKFIEIWRNSVSKTGFFLLPLMVFLLFAANDFMSFFFGPKYVVSAGIFRIFLLLLPLRLAFYSQALLSLGKQKFYMYSAVAEMFLGGLASYFFLRIYGLEGAAVGKVLVTYVEVIVLVGMLASLLGTNVVALFPWKKLFKLVLISAVGLIPLLLIRQLFGNVYLRFIAECVVFGGVFGAIALATKSVRIINFRKMQFVVN
jgi:O-antigen/teichoic acid export membrane protein